MLLSRPRINGSYHSSGYGSCVRKIVFNAYNCFKDKWLKKNEAD
jgi:hypothetical protein